MMRPFTIIRVATLLLPIFIAGHPLLKGNHMNNSEMLRCGVENPDERAVAERDKAVAFHHFQRRRQPNTNNNIFRENRLEKVIPVCFHIPQSIFSYIFFFLGGYIFRRDIQSQLDHLNTAFSTASCCDARESWCQGECSIDTRIRFELAKQTRTGELLSDETTSDASSRRACIERVQNISWTSFYYRGDEVRDMKTALRKGDASVLNIYLSSPTAGRRDVLGFATYPWEYENDPAMDGVVVRRSTMPEGTYDNAGEGDTLVNTGGLLAYQIIRDQRLIHGIVLFFDRCMRLGEYF